jgi:hypothetical protein
MFLFSIGYPGGAAGTIPLTMMTMLLGALVCVAIAFHGAGFAIPSRGTFLSEPSCWSLTLSYLTPDSNLRDMGGGAFTKNCSSSPDNNNYALSPTGEFVGKYASIRQGLDYTYHRAYSASRQRLQDGIIDAMMTTTDIKDHAAGRHCDRPQIPWTVFTAGAMGAGKSHVMKILGQRGYFPLDAFVVVDPDQIRRQLPEFEYYTKYYPDSAGELTRKEAGLIAEIAIESGLQRGYNILVDGSLSNATWYASCIPTLRRNYPSVRIAIIHVSAPREIVLERASVCAVERYTEFVPGIVRDLTSCFAIIPVP